VSQLTKVWETHLNLGSVWVLQNHRELSATSSLKRISVSLILSIEVVNQLRRRESEQPSNS
jgi:hypothetical protein